jgi:carboxylate-amine ligase
MVRSPDEETSVPVPRPSFTLGVEEEYLLVDPVTRDLVDDPPPEMMTECEEILGSQVTAEFLRAQIEVGTRVCKDIAEVREDLIRLRRTVIDVAASHGMAVIAASTHPFAHWGRQQVTPKERYQLLARDLQVVVRRLMIGGMHVHLGIEDPDLRIDLLDQVTYFVPHLLALSTSSPFWQGHRTGLKSYRLSVFRSMPRAGLPEHFSSWGEYRRHVNVLVEAGLIEDASHLWWDIRPSERFPTVEMRITDICTRVDDGVTIAALYLSIMGMLYERRINNQRWRKYVNMLISENVWQAQRYGVAGNLVDYGKGESVPYAQLVEELIELTRPNAEEFGCVAEVEAARDIVARGTSADHQLTCYEQARAEGADEHEALQQVVDLLIEETRLGV